MTRLIWRSFELISMSLCDLEQSLSTLFQQDQRVDSLGKTTIQIAIKVLHCDRDFNPVHMEVICIYANFAYMQILHT